MNDFALVTYQKNQRSLGASSDSDDEYNDE